MVRTNFSFRMRRLPRTMASDRHALLREQWDKLLEERNAYLEGTDSALISGHKASVGN
jgi:hypothetical protein